MKYPTGRPHHLHNFFIELHDLLLADLLTLTCGNQRALKATTLRKGLPTRRTAWHVRDTEPTDKRTPVSVSYLQRPCRFCLLVGSTLPNTPVRCDSWLEDCHILDHCSTCLELSYEPSAR